MKISFIIVNYKVDRDVIICINSIIKFCDIKDYEIIIVDNSEKSNLKNKLSYFNSVKYLKSDKNLGFGAGCNMGANAAIGQYLFFLNPDSEIFEGKVSKLLTLFTDRKTGAVAPALFDKNRNLYQQGTKLLTPLRGIFSLSLFSRIFPNNPIRKDYYLDMSLIDRKTQTEIIPGTAFIIQKKKFENVGGFDEKYFLYFEEFDLFKRFIGKGYKNYISNMVKLSHKWGESTKKRNDINRIFEESRYYYFKKNYGIFWGLITELILRTRTQHFLIVLILIISAFLRFYKLDELMIFLGDQGWFYISALEMLKNGTIPLVGIPSSVVWLHQGPLSTYFIALSLLVGNLNPVSPAILFSMLDVLAVFVIYLVGNRLFGRWVGLLSSFFYATSPLVLIHSRTPYHTSLIPLFMAFFMLLVANFDKIRDRLFYFLIFLALGLLIQLELSNAVLFLYIAVLAFFKIIKFRRANIAPSFFGILLGSLPVVAYDITNNFIQSLGFPLWVINRARLFFGISLNDSSTLGNFPVALFTILNQMAAIFSSQYISIFIIFILMLVFVVISIRGKAIWQNFLIVFLAFSIPLLSFFIHSAPGVAYFPLLFPIVSVLVGFVFYKISLKIKFFYLLLIILGFINSFSMLTNNYFITTKEQVRTLPVNDYNYGFTYLLPLELSSYITESSNQTINLKGEGVLGLFPASMDNIKFFLIIQSKSLSEKNGQKITVSDQNFKMENPDYSSTVYKLKFDEENNN